MNTSQPAISAVNLTKKYKGASQDAVHQLAINVMPGEVYGFLGPNGAGKSTTIRMLLDFIKPTSGAASILGFDTQVDSVTIKSQIGYLSGDVALYPKMSGQQFLNYMADLHPLKHPAYLSKLVKTFKADINVPINSLSKGNRQKIGIIQALMHEPEVLVLDEPTSGLDPLMQEAFYDVLAEVSAEGTAVFVSSHNLAEVQKMCQRVGIIKEGKLVSENTIAELRIAAAQTFDIEFASKPPIEQLEKAFGKKFVSVSGNKAVVKVSGELTALFKILAVHPVKHLTTRELNLEEEFMHFYGENTK